MNFTRPRSRSGAARPRLRRPVPRTRRPRPTSSSSPMRRPPPTTVGSPGSAATRPARGAKMDIASGHVRAYLNYSRRRSAARAFASRLGAVVHRYGFAFNGFAAKLTDAQAQALKTSSGRADRRRVGTAQDGHDAHARVPRPQQAGRSLVSARCQRQPIKGENVIIGVVDSGVWPEDPSFGDKVDGNGKPVAYSKPARRSTGRRRPSGRAFARPARASPSAMCNNKLIGARFYVTGFDAGGGTLTSFEYRSPRSGGGDGGHGTHTASTAGGNSNVDASIDGIAVGVMSGHRPARSRWRSTRSAGRRRWRPRPAATPPTR